MRKFFKNSSLLLLFVMPVHLFAGQYEDITRQNIDSVTAKVGADLIAKGFSEEKLLAAFKDSSLEKAKDAFLESGRDADLALDYVSDESVQHWPAAIAAATELMDNAQTVWGQAYQIFLLEAEMFINDLGDGVGENLTIEKIIEARKKFVEAATILAIRFDRQARYRDIMREVHRHRGQAQLIQAMY